MEAAGTATDLVAFDAHSGVERWRVGLSAEIFAPDRCGQLVCTQRQDRSEELVARDPATGAIVWTSPGPRIGIHEQDGLLTGLHLGTPVVSALDLATGETRWRTDLRPPLGAAATTNGGWSAHVVNDIAIVSVWDLDGTGRTAVVDPSTGEVPVAWRGLGLCPVSPGDLVLLCDSADVIHRIDPTTTKELWTVDQLEFPENGVGPTLGLAADGSTLFGRSASGEPIGIDVTTGAPSATPAPGDVAWMRVWGNLVDVRVTTVGGTSIKKYSGSYDLVPWDPSANAAANVVEAASDVPHFAGLTRVGFRIFTDAFGTVRALRV